MPCMYVTLVKGCLKGWKKRAKSAIWDTVGGHLQRTGMRADSDMIGSKDERYECMLDRYDNVISAAKITYHETFFFQGRRCVGNCLLEKGKWGKTDSKMMMKIMCRRKVYNG